MAIIAEKSIERQMSLLDAEEWRVQNPAVKGTDVINFHTGHDCAEERVLSSQLLAGVAELSSLEQACRKIVSNGEKRRSVHT